MKFELGRIVATPDALRELAVARQTALEFVRRHSAGDWGDCGPADARANDEALREGSRIFSVYRLATGTKIWVITEAEYEGHRASTCVLLPENY
jgi:hypothetical protein